MFIGSKNFITRVSMLLLCLLLTVVLAGCSNAKKETVGNNTGKASITVAVSIVPEASFVKAVGGDYVKVETMIPPGASPENYSPSPQVMEQVSKANIYFAIGVPAETSGILPRLQELNTNMKVVDLAGKVDQVYPAREMAPGQKDPHRWMSPKRAQEMIKIIAQELAAIDKDHAKTYQQNAVAYQKQLQELDRDIRSSLVNVEGKSFIVYHPAMGYFADDYGLKMIALETEGKEATVQDFQAVIDQAKKDNIKVVFFQAEMDSKQAQTLAQELGGQAELIAPLSPDYIDNLRKTALVFSRTL